MLRVAPGRLDLKRAATSLRPYWYGSLNTTFGPASEHPFEPAHRLQRAHGAT